MNVSRRVYSLVVALATPLVFLWVALRRREFLHGFTQRLGFSLPHGQACVWVHAASVGEVQGVAPLVSRLLDSVHGPLLFTTFTPTGAEQVGKKFGNKLLQSYVPWDTPDSVKRFLRHFRPRLLIVMETEVWPNLYHYCRQQNVPIVIVNARLSDKAFQRYHKSPRLFGATFKGIRLVCARSSRDAENFQALGVAKERIRVTGNIKFIPDIDPRLVVVGRQLKAHWRRKVWLAASTHQGEDEILLDAHRQLLAQHPDLLLILAPRHPQRAKEVANLIQQAGYSVAKRSQNDAVTGNASVLLVDTLGELLCFYASADIAFIGGSLVDVGGHNPLEAAALGCPVVSGRQVHNFRDEYNLLADSNAVAFVETTEDLVQVVSERWRDPARFDAMARAAHAMVDENQGSLATTLTILEPLIPTNH